jgi:hypothetical protein
MTSRHSVATYIRCRFRSCPSASARRQAIASRVAGVYDPCKVRAEASKKVSFYLRQTIASTLPSPFFDVAASAFSFANPCGTPFSLRNQSE